MKRSLPPWPKYTEEEIAAVSSVLRSGKVNYWTGNECKSFEKEYAESLGSKHAISVANGTVALELALKSLDLKEGDEVVVSPRTFVASATCIALCGFKPVFADVDSDSGNISAETIEPVLTAKTRAVIVVHLGGLPCEMEAIMSLARDRGLAVIEDCAQAHGAKYRGVAAGSIGTIGAFSFCQDKIISTGGEGGMVFTNSEELWDRMWSYKDHGKSFDTVFRKSHPPGFRWLHESMGTNWRMTEMQAAIGRLQLEKLDEVVAVRQRNAGILQEMLKKFSFVKVPKVQDYSVHSYYRFHVYLDPSALRAEWSRDRVINEIADAGGACFSGTCCEVYLEKAFTSRGFGPERRLPNAQYMTENSLMFPVHSSLEAEDVDFISDLAERILIRAGR